MKLSTILLSTLLTVSLSVCAQRQTATAENISMTQSNVSAAPTPSMPAPSPTPLVSEIKFVSKSINEHGANVYEMKMLYPQVEGLESKHAKAFSNWIEKFVLSDVNDFRGLEKAATKKDKGKTRSIEDSLDISYEVIFADKNLISIRFTHTVMASGQMHPIDYPMPVNYDLKNGRVLKLENLFKPKAHYLKAFSLFCRDELKKKYTDPLMIEGTKPKAENYANWNIAPEGIMISFDDYQVCPHSMGRPVLIIPYSVLKDFIASDSVVSAFLNNSL